MWGCASCVCLTLWFQRILHCLFTHSCWQVNKQATARVCVGACTDLSCVQTKLCVINLLMRRSGAEKIALHTIYHTQVSLHSQRWNRYYLLCLHIHNNNFLNVSIFARPTLRKPNYQNIKMKYKLLLSDEGFWKITTLEHNIMHC